MQLLGAAEAKASFGLASNWKPLNKIIEHLMEHETLTGPQLVEILNTHDGLFFPDPFVQGFGYHEDGEYFYPGSDEACYPHYSHSSIIRTTISFENTEIIISVYNLDGGLSCKSALSNRLPTWFRWQDSFWFTSSLCRLIKSYQCQTRASRAFKIMFPLRSSTLISVDPLQES